MNITIRADASVQIGTGHVMRCLALAQAWRRTGGSVVFASSETTDALEARLVGEGFQSTRLAVIPGTTEDARTTAELARHQNASWVVADGYHFGLEFQQVIKAAGLRLLLLDDYGHAEEYVADLILNQNLAVDASLYAKRTPHTRLLLGTRYALLREEFLSWRDWKREIPPVARKVLVTLGGSDPDNVTGKVIQALADVPDLEVIVVVGGSNPHLEDIKFKIQNSKFKIILNATNMPELMAWADVAIAAGGSTSWELAIMGLPSLVLVLAENQRGIAKALEAANAACYSTTERLSADMQGLLNNRELRCALSQRGRQMVDGYGTNRVTACLITSGLELRRLQAADCRTIWDWANEPMARAASINTAPITWDVHQAWFSARLNSPDCRFYLAINRDKTLVGQIRFDIGGVTAVVSVSLAKEARGHGYGVGLIRLGVEHCFADSEIEIIRAYIKPDNEASARAFMKAGFNDDGTAEVAGEVMRQFIMLREWIL